MGSLGGSWGFFSCLWRSIWGFSFQPKDTVPSGKDIQASIEDFKAINSHWVTVLMCEESYQRHEQLYREKPFQPLEPPTPCLKDDQSHKDIEKPVHDDDSHRPVEVVSEVVYPMEGSIGKDSEYRGDCQPLQSGTPASSNQ